MHRLLVRCLLLLSLPALACRKPCADTDSCLAIRTSFSDPKLAEDVLSYKAIALDEHCAVVKEYIPKQMLSPPLPQALEIRVDDIDTVIPRKAKWLRLVAQNQPGSSRLRPVTWQINHDRNIYSLEANFSPVSEAIFTAPITLDSSKQILFAPKTSERPAPLLLVAGSTKVEPLWVQISHEIRAIEGNMAGSMDCNLIQSEKPMVMETLQHISFSPSRLSYSILLEHSSEMGALKKRVKLCEINTADGPRRTVKTVIVYNASNGASWHYQTDKSDPSTNSCFMLSYDSSDKLINPVGCNGGGTLGSVLENASPGSYAQMDGEIINYIQSGSTIIPATLTQIEFTDPRGMSPGYTEHTLTLTDPMFPLTWRKQPIIKMADLNQDRSLDVVALDTPTKTLYWMFSADTFPPPGAAPAWPARVGSASQLVLDETTASITAISLGDIDGDLIPDLVVAFSDKTSIYWGTGTGFAAEARSDVPGSGGVSALAVGDLDGDCAAEVALGGVGQLRIATLAAGRVTEGP